jgi:hypothetical protein
MQNYDKTKLIEALDKLVIMRDKIDRYVIPDKLFDDIKKADDLLEDALLDFECQIFANRKIKEAV